MYFSWQLEMGPEESGSCTSGLKFFWVWLPDQSESSPKKAGFSHCSTTLLLSTLHSRTLNDEIIFSNNCATEQCHRERTSRTTLCKRYLGLERRKVNDYRGKIFNLALLHSLFNHGSQKLEIKTVMHLHIVRRYWILREIVLFRAPLVNRKKTIESFREMEIPNLFRFRSKEQLNRMLIGLKIPDKIVLPSRNTCSGEEMLLVGLIRISSVSRQQDPLQSCTGSARMTSSSLIPKNENLRPESIRQLRSVRFALLSFCVFVFAHILP